VHCEVTLLWSLVILPSI